MQAEGRLNSIKDRPPTDSFELDMVDWEIVELLQRDGRVSIAQVARKLRMAPPSVTDRIKRLEKAGVITGYRAH